MSAGWTVLEGPYEYVGGQRLKLRNADRILGIDMFSVDLATHARLWTLDSEQDSIVELRELGPSVDLAALSEALIEEIELAPQLEVTQGIGDHVDLLALLLSAASEDWASLLARRCGVPNLSADLRQFAEDLKLLSAWHGVHTLVDQLDAAVKLLVVGYSNSDAYSQSHAHEVLRDVGRSPLGLCLSSAVLVNESSGSLQRTVSRAHSSELSGGLGVLHDIGVWWNRRDGIANQVLIPALTDESWIMSDTERFAYARLAIGFVNVEHSRPSIVFERSSKAAEQLTQALLVSPTEAAAGMDPATYADELLARLHRNVGELSIVRQMRRFAELDVDRFIARQIEPSSERDDTYLALGQRHAVAREYRARLDSLALRMAQQVLRFAIRDPETVTRVARTVGQELADRHDRAPYLAVH